jgi:hypothetical protein
MASSKNTMKPIRLIVAADEPALFFSSTDLAQKYIEAVDVRDGVYPEAYGPRGEPYDIAVDECDGIVISRREGYAPQPERLRRILEDFLNACNINSLTSVTLEDLLILCNPYVDDGII